MRSVIGRGLAIAAGSLLAATPALAQVNGVVQLPEPASWMIMAVGAVGVAFAVSRNRRK